MARSRKFLTAGAVGVAAVALIAASTSVTGAYFTDSHDGSITANSGAVKVTTSDLALTFTDLLPGEFQTKPVTFTGGGTAPEDIWLVLGTAPTDVKAFLNGQKGSTGEDAALGRYGHFAVESPAGPFTSFNLTTAPVAGMGDTCTVDADGHGGSDAQSAYKTQEPKPPYCPVPQAILLSSNLPGGVTQTAQVTFGYTKILKGPNMLNAPSYVVAPFKIVATQHGILPTDINNP